jgi:hypothetical protein
LFLRLKFATPRLFAEIDPGATVVTVENPHGVFADRNGTTTDPASDFGSSAALSP